MKLTPEVLEEIQNQYPKVMCLEVDGDDYVFRYPGRDEVVAMQKLHIKEKEKLNKGITKVLDETQLLNLVHGLCVFPEAEVYQAALEIDGFLGELLAGNVVSTYFNRNRVTQKDKE